MTFTYPMELVVLRARLEFEGIECKVQDEYTIQVNSFYSNAIGGIKLQVKECDVQRAIEILKEGDYINDAKSQLSKKIIQFADATSKQCPNCGSSEISKPKLSRKAFAISALLLGFPLPFVSRVYHCFDCGQDFKKRKNYGKT